MGIVRVRKGFKQEGIKINSLRYVIVDISKKTENIILLRVDLMDRSREIFTRECHPFVFERNRDYYYYYY